jgi:RES domain-containing protein
MIVFRLTKAKYSHDLSGAGAEKTGGRWNSKGKPMIYTSMSRALCVSEIAVHLPLGLVPRDYQLVSIEIPEGAAILEIDANKLPQDWKLFPHPNSTRKFGDDFITSGMYLVLKVPSAVVEGDFNYLINPAHLDFINIKISKIEAFNFDERLFKK